MSIGKRILLSIPLGWIIAIVLMLIAFNIENKDLAKILMWNLGLFMALAGNGPLLGYDAQGHPMYEGTPVHWLFALLGFASSFVIYPVLAFLALTVVKNFYSRKKTPLSEF